MQPPLRLFPQRWHHFDEGLDGLLQILLGVDDGWVELLRALQDAPFQQAGVEPAHHLAVRRKVGLVRL